MILREAIFLKPNDTVRIERGDHVDMVLITELMLKNGRIAVTGASGYRRAQIEKEKKQNPLAARHISATIYTEFDLLPTDLVEVTV